MKKDTVAIYSGGMDSFTLLCSLHDQGRLHSALSFDYGQRHSKELDYARAVCATLSIPHTVVDLSFMRPLFQGSALTDDAVPLPLGHYAEESMKLTVVPNRNMIMLSIAIAHAIAQKVTRVAYGAHAGDHAIYPDCREAFVESMRNTAALCDWHGIEIHVPYLHMDKADILRVGDKLRLDYAHSWTCYAGGEKACGKCGSCRERLEAFEMIGRDDPLEYQV